MPAPKIVRKVVGLLVAPVPPVRDRTLDFVDQLVILNVNFSETTSALAVLGQFTTLCEKFCPGVLRLETRLYGSVPERVAVHINIRFQNELAAETFTIDDIPFEEWLMTNEKVGLWAVRQHIKDFQMATCFDRGTAGRNVLDEEEGTKKGAKKKEKEKKKAGKTLAKLEKKERKLAASAGAMGAGAEPSGAVEVDEPAAEEEGPVYDEEGIEMSEVRKGKRKAP